MKRILIILLIITMTGVVFADDDVLSSDLNVYLTVNPDTFGVIKLQNSDDTTTYDTTTPVTLTLNNNVQGVGEAYLYYYAIGPASISLTIKSSLKNTTGSGADNTINYSIALAVQEGWLGNNLSFSPSSISSGGTSNISSATIAADSVVRTKGTCKLSFATLDSLQNKNFGTYKSEIEVKYTSTT